MIAPLWIVGLELGLGLGLGALLVAVIAYVIARRTARQVAELTQMYWQLKFDHGELKAKVDPSQPKPPEPKSTFVPLSSIKKS